MRVTDIFSWAYGQEAEARRAPRSRPLRWRGWTAYEDPDGWFIATKTGKRVALVDPQNQPVTPGKGGRVPISVEQAMSRLSLDVDTTRFWSETSKSGLTRQ